MPKVFVRPKKNKPSHNIIALVEERDGIQDSIKKLDARLKEINGRIDKYMADNGVKNSKGSLLLKVFANGRDRVVAKEVRKSVKINPERAEELFRKKKIWKEVTDTVEVINEGYVEQAVHNKKISLKELESITDIKESFAIVVRDYKEEEADTV
jgi:hypothetical protein